VNFLLDTCVLSELVKPQPEPKVVGWVGDQDEFCLFLSVITIGELHKGIAKLPCGPRRTGLESWVAEDLTARFDNRILSVDTRVAATWGAMLGEAEAAGNPLPVIDALIGATASVHGCVVVTRNAADFERIGVDVKNPW
jgi:predicted nucleic acid-binding protein